MENCMFYKSDRQTKEVGAINFCA